MQARPAGEELHAADWRAQNSASDVMSKCSPDPGRTKRRQERRTYTMNDERRQLAPSQILTTVWPRHEGVTRKKSGSAPTTAFSSYWFVAHRINTVRKETRLRRRYLYVYTYIYTYIWPCSDTGTSQLHIHCRRPTNQLLSRGYASYSWPA